jgi:hypothetical protein
MEETSRRFQQILTGNLLRGGVPASNVVDLLADDEKTVREHHSRWVPERQGRLTNSQGSVR